MRRAGAMAVVARKIDATPSGADEVRCKMHLVIELYTAWVAEINAQGRELWMARE